MRAAEIQLKYSILVPRKAYVTRQGSSLRPQPLKEGFQPSANVFDQAHGDLSKEIFVRRAAGTPAGWGQVRHQVGLIGYVERRLNSVDATGLRLTDLATLDRQKFDLVVVFNRFSPIKGTWLDVAPLRDSRRRMGGYRQRIDSAARRIAIETTHFKQIR